MSRTFSGFDDRKHNQFGAENNVLSSDFFEILESGKAVASVAKQLHSKGYTNTVVLVPREKQYPSTTGSTPGIRSPIPILSSATCQSLVNTTIPNLFQGKFDTNIYPDEWHWRQGISRNDAAREMCNAWKSSRAIASIVLQEQLGQFVAGVMGWDSVRIAQDDIVWKPPQPRGDQQRLRPQSDLEGDFCNKDTNRIDTVGFHQDSAYISAQFKPYDNNSVTVWMALDDADDENGCLEYAVGSHRWRPIHHQNEIRRNGINETDHQFKNSERCHFSEPNDGDGHLQQKDDQQKETSSNTSLSSFHGSDESSYRKGALEDAHLAYMENWRSDNDKTDNHAIKLDIQSAPVKMGHAVVHHQDVWHGSGPNKSVTRHRRALVGHYLRGDVKFDSSDCDRYDRFRQPFGKTSYIYGRYKRFKSTEVDETFFPIIYSTLGAEGGLKRTEWVDDYIASQ